MIKINNKEKLFLLLLLLIIGYIISDHFFYKKADVSNHDFVVWLQSSNSNVLDGIFKFFSIFGYDEFFLTILIVLYFFYSHKTNILKFSAYLSICSYLISLVNIFYNHPRPYYVYTDIEAKMCDQGYGNPSTNSAISLLFFAILHNSFRNSRFEISRNSSLIRPKNASKQNFLLVQSIKSSGKKKKYTFLLIVIIFLWIMIGLSKIFLGLCSFNSIILGWMFGFLFFSFYSLIMEEPLETFINNLSFGGYEYREKLITAVFLFFGYIFALAGSIGLFKGLNPQIPNEWVIQNEIKCQKGRAEISNQNFINSSFYNAFFAICFSLLITKGSYNPENFKNSFKILTFPQKVSRFLLLSVVIITYLSFQFIPMGSNPYVLYFFKNGIVFWIVIFYLVKLIPLIYWKLGLDIDGDFLRYSPSRTNSSVEFKQGIYTKATDNNLL